MIESFRYLRGFRGLFGQLVGKAKRSRGRISQSPRRRQSPLMMLEALEERIVPASVDSLSGFINYVAAPGETNAINMSPGFLTFISDASTVTILQLPPGFSSNWLSAVSFSIGTSVGVGVQIDLSVSFPIIPFLLAQNGVFFPSIAGATDAGSATNFAGTIASTVSQLASSVVSGADALQSGDVFYKVTGSSRDIIDDYELYQVVADPTVTLAESGGISDISSAVFKSATPGKTVTGTVAQSSTDSFVFTGQAGKRYVVMLDADPERDGKLTSTDLRISDFGGFLIGTPLQRNLSISGFNAVGAIDVAVSGPQFVQVSNTGFGADDSYRFVVLEVDPVADRVFEGNGVVASTDVPKAIPDFSAGNPGVVTSTLTVSGATGTLADLNATLDITHPFVGDLTVDLTSPGGTTVRLINRVGVGGDNFTNTTLDDDFAFNPISGGTAPFSSTFAPSNPLSAFNGQNPNGVWTLTVSDNAANDTGTLNSWSLKLGSTSTNDTTAGAGVLADGKFGSGQINPTGEVDFWKTPGANATDVVYSYVDTNGSTKNKDSKLTVLANDGTTIIASDDNSGPPGVSSTGLGNLQDAFDKGGIDLDALSELLSGARIDAGDRNDSVNVSAFNSGNTIFGGTGDDTVLGGGGNDSIELGDGFDVANGGAGKDTITGGAGDDTITGGAGDDSLDGGDGSDQFLVNTAFASTDVLIGGAGDDQLLVPGSDGDDVITLTIDPTAPNEVLIDVNGTVMAFKIASDDVEQLHVRGGLGNDRLIISDAGLDPDAAVLFFKGTDGTSGLIRVGANAPYVTFDGIEEVTPLDGDLTRPDGTARLVVFAPDPFEVNGSSVNDTRVFATHLGTGATINLDPTITPAGDVDFYQFIASETGTMDFQVYFEENVGLPGSGNLDIQVLDNSGNVIGSSTSSDDNERVRIPAVQGQIYFLKVFGATDVEINTYEMSVINTPAPVPFGIELDDAQTTPPSLTNGDTGRSQFDNVTADNTPTIFLRLSDAGLLNDLPGNATPGSPPDQVIPIAFNSATTAASTTAGFRVAIFDENNQHTPVASGFAQPVGGQPGVYSFTFGTALTDGSHFLTARVQMIDPATPNQSGFGAFSQALEIVVDTITPPTVQTAVNHLNLELDATSDSGILGFPATFTDHVTNDTTPTFSGYAEANAIVRLYATNTSSVLVQIGQTIVYPADGTNQFGLSPNLGHWSLTSNVDLNSIAAGFTKDGLRVISATFEDLAGNVSAPITLNTFIDTQGPQVFDVEITGEPDYDLFDPKPVDGPTPRTDSLTITFQDLPDRSTAAFPGYAALLTAFGVGAAEPGHYVLRGDANGVIPIESVTITLEPAVNGEAGLATAELTFSSPLPDDRFTLTINDSIFDPAGNKLDGESNAKEPQEDQNFPSGDDVPGGEFVARFTIDSRSEIGGIGQGGITVDINGNMHFDPTNTDFVNRDLAFEFGLNTDRYFAGKFNPAAAVDQDGFDRIGGYGMLNRQYRWLLDFNNDGRPDYSVLSGLQVNGTPISGDFNPAHVGDEIGLFDGKKWYLDTNSNNNIDAGDRTFVGNLRGVPITGDFDGDGLVDLAVHNAQLDTFYFDLTTAADGTLGVLDGNSDYTINFNNPAVPMSQTLLFPGVLERPFAGDFNLDGITDIGLMVPNRNGAAPNTSTAEYFIFQSIAAVAVPGTAAALNHQFSPKPLGVDLYAQFGSNVSVPMVGNFDPPVSGGLSISSPVIGSTAVVSITPVDDLASETASGQPANTGTFRITRTGDTTEPLTVSVTRTGTATINRDYTLSVNGATFNGRTVVIPAGQSSLDVVVVAKDDSIAESDETISLALGMAVNYLLDSIPANNSATINLADNEPIVSITAIDNSAVEPTTGVLTDTATFRISRTGSLESSLTVNFSRGGTAGLNSNYQFFVNGVRLTGSSVKIQAGQSFVDVVVVPLNDKKASVSKSVVLTLSSSRLYNLDAAPAARMATAIITDRN